MQTACSTQFQIKYLPAVWTNYKSWVWRHVISNKSCLFHVVILIKTHSFFWDFPSHTFYFSVVNMVVVVGVMEALGPPIIQAVRPIKTSEKPEERPPYLSHVLHIATERKTNSGFRTKLIMGDENNIQMKQKCVSLNAGTLLKSSWIPLVNTVHSSQSGSWQDRNHGRWVIELNAEPSPQDSTPIKACLFPH